jgi:transcriptional regulator with XRE-family HTH domain
MKKQTPAALLSTVAANIRALREQRGLSLSELSKRAGVGKATLFALEASRSNPNVETLWAIATSLNVPFGQLIQPASGEVRVIRAGEGQLLHSGSAGFRTRLLVASGRRCSVELYALELAKGRPRKAEPHAAGTAEQLFVTHGQMKVGPTGSEVVVKAGDFMAFPADCAHVYEALTANACALVVMEYR